MISRFEVRVCDGQFHVYDLARGDAGILEPALAIDLPVDRARLHGFAAHPGHQGVAYATEAEVVRLDADGRVLWRLDLGPQVEHTFIARVGCEFSCDGELLWVYVPDGLTGRGVGLDRLLAVDARGRVLAESELESAGHGAEIFAHPDGHVLVDVGEGQDGIVISRCRVDGGRLIVNVYPWVDRCLIAVAPDGSGFMTVAHDERDVAFHTYPRGEIVFTLTPADFGEIREDAFVEWSGGYLDAGTVVVVLGGEDEATEQEWHQHYLADVVAGAACGSWRVESADVNDIRPLGDGTWLRSRADGSLVRDTR